LLHLLWWPQAGYSGAIATAQEAAVEYQLTPNRPLRLEQAEGQTVECLEGTAWITAYGQHTDFVLRCGQQSAALIQ
jgi:hypothetical protein